MVTTGATFSGASQKPLMRVEDQCYPMAQSGSERLLRNMKDGTGALPEWNIPFYIIHSTWMFVVRILVLLLDKKS